MPYLIILGHYKGIHITIRTPVVDKAGASGSAMVQREEFHPRNLAWTWARVDEAGHIAPGFRMWFRSSDSRPHD